MITVTLKTFFLTINLTRESLITFKMKALSGFSLVFLNYLRFTKFLPRF